MKRSKPNYGSLILIIVGIIVVGKIVESVGKGGLVFISVIIIYFYFNNLKSKRMNGSSKGRNDLYHNYNEDGKYKYYITSVKESDEFFIYFQVCVPKGNQDFNIIIKELGLHEDGWSTSDVKVNVDDSSIYIYNIKSKKWNESYSPFYNRTPSSFINFMTDKWKEVNGVFEHRKNKNKITDVDITAKEYQLEKIDYNKFSSYKSVSVRGANGNVYSVNLASLTCSCPDFKKRRAIFEHGDIRRLCKHLAKQIVTKQLNTSVIRNKMNQSFIRKASSTYSGVPIFNKIIFIKIKEPVKGIGEFYLLLNDDNKNWVNVIWFTERTYAKYGYNISEKRWAYGENPFPSGYKTKYNLAIQKAHAMYSNK